MAGQIIICGESFEVEHDKVVTFLDENGYNAYMSHNSRDPGILLPTDAAPGLENRMLRYRKRRSMGNTEGVKPARLLRRLRGVVKQVVVHLDGCLNAAMCFRVLHDQRGLSVHFMVDNDGTIYQTLDLMDCAFHAGGVNEVSVGIEIQNRGDAARYPGYYLKHLGEEREKLTCRVHGHQFLAYAFTEAQYEAMVRLAATLSRALEIPLSAPETGGQLVWSTIDAPRRFRGFLGHYHIERQKWDPGPFDFRRLFRAVGSKVTFPLDPLPRRVSTDQETRLLAAAAERHYELSERDPRIKAHFPVGPLGRSRLWHGGVHLRAEAGAPLFAPLRGEIVAARIGRPCPVGSCNFLLMRHQLVSDAGTHRFFSLYYHLKGEDFSGWTGTVLPWVERAREKRWHPALLRGETVLIEEDVPAGEVVGHVGEAGPPGHREAQVHFAVFAATPIHKELDVTFWEARGSGDLSRLCNDPFILGRIDRPGGGKPRDGALSPRELRRYFTREIKREEMRRLVVHHRSEWTPGDWERDLARAPDFARLPGAERQYLVRQQVLPTLWWTDDLARHVGLPADGVIYSYHPVSFLSWFRRLSEKMAKLRAVGIGDAGAWEGKLAPEQFTVDAESAAGMIDEEDQFSQDKTGNLSLEVLANGYPD